MSDMQSLLSERFVCAKCGGHGANVESLAMSGTGLSRLLDFQHHHYAFASCQNCGHTEVYNLRILSGRASQGMNILDVLFGA